MARGERDGPAPRIGGALVVLAGVGLVLLGACAVVFRTWHVDRPLLPGTDLVLRRRGNMLGSSCELVRRDDGRRTPWACGASASWPTMREDDSVVVVADMNERTCAVELESLRTIGCVDAWTDWVGASADSVALEWHRHDSTAYVQSSWLTRIDRSGTSRRSVAVPEDAELVSSDGHLFAVGRAGDPPERLELIGQGWRASPP